MTSLPDDAPSDSLIFFLNESSSRQNLSEFSF